MDKVNQAIQSLEELGYSISLEGGEVKLRLKDGEPEPDRGQVISLIKRLKENKSKVVSYLSDKSDISDTLISKNKLLLALAGEVGPVDLDGKQYHASNLVRLIIDYPCKLKWSREEGFKVDPGGYEDWSWFRSNYLEPNQDQIIELFELAHKEYLSEIKKFEWRIKGDDIAN